MRIRLLVLEYVENTAARGRSFARLKGVSTKLSRMEFASVMVPRNTRYASERDALALPRRGECVSSTVLW